MMELKEKCLLKNPPVKTCGFASPLYKGAFKCCHTLAVCHVGAAISRPREAKRFPYGHLAVLCRDSGYRTLVASVVGDDVLDVPYSSGRQQSLYEQ